MLVKSAFIFLLYTASCCTYAQTVPATSSRQIVAKATDVIAPPSAPLPLGTRVAFNLRSGVNVTTNFPQGLIVRIFSMNAYDTRPQPDHSDGDCDVFFPVSYRLETDVAGRLQASTIGALDSSWLSLTASGGSFGTGHYLFVFEHRESGSSLEGAFKLKHAAVTEYFQNGFKVAVAPDATVSLATVATHMEKRHDTLVEMRRTSDAIRGRCYTVVPRPVRLATSDEIDRTALVACDGASERDVATGS